MDDLIKRLRAPGTTPALRQMYKLRPSAADELTRLRGDVAEKHSVIDALMLEYCPDEMTPEQIAGWGRHQKPIAEPRKAALDNEHAREVGLDYESSPDCGRYHPHPRCRCAACISAYPTLAPASPALPRGTDGEK